MQIKSCFPSGKEGTGDRAWRASAPTWTSMLNLLPMQNGPGRLCGRKCVWKFVQLQEGHPEFGGLQLQDLLILALQSL